MDNLEPNAFMDDDGVHFWWYHDCNGRRDEVMMPHSGGTWKVITKNPLTVTPSIHCTACGTHGWIAKGKWINA